MPVSMLACGTFSVLLLGSAGSYMQIAHVSVLPTSPLLANSMLLCLQGPEAHESVCQPFAGYDLRSSAWKKHDIAVWIHNEEAVRIDRHQDVL